MVLGLSQCRKPAMSSYSGPVGDRVFQHVTVSTGYGDNNSKLDLSNVAGQLKLTWTENDVMKVYEGGENVSGDGLKIVGPISEDGLSATFEGDILAGDGELTFRVGKKPTSFELQQGTLDYIKEYLFCIENTNQIYFNLEGKYNISMGLPYALLKIDLSYFGSDTKGDMVTVTIAKKAENKASDEVIASVECAPDKLGEVYVAIPADFVEDGGESETKTYVFSVPGTEKSVEMPFPIGANSFYTSNNGSGQGSGNPIVIKPHETVNFCTPNLEWSVCNLGASKPEDYGDYYAWGETAPYYQNGAWCEHPSHNSGITFDASAGYGWKNYLDGSSTSWDASKDWKPYGTGTTLTSDHDAATQAWGGYWRMPTTAEWKALYENNTFEWLKAGDSSEKVEGFKAVAAGYLVVKGGKNSDALDASVYMFLPAAGDRSGTSLIFAGSSGYYWSSSLDSSNPYFAYNMGFYSGNVTPQDRSNRYFGFSVRPVRAAR